MYWHRAGIPAFLQGDQRWNRRFTQKRMSQLVWSVQHPTNKSFQHGRQKVKTNSPKLSSDLHIPVVCAWACAPSAPTPITDNEHSHSSCTSEDQPVLCTCPAPPLSLPAVCRNPSCSSALMDIAKHSGFIPVISEPSALVWNSHLSAWWNYCCESQVLSEWEKHAPHPTGQPGLGLWPVACGLWPMACGLWTHTVLGTISDAATSMISLDNESASAATQPTLSN